MPVSESRPADAVAGEDVGVSFLTLHRDAGRNAYFACRPWPAPVFDPTLGSWVVIDPADCERLLRMPELRPGTADIAAAHDALEARYGVRFAALDAIFPHVPLCAHGAAHREARRRMAKLLGDRRAALLAALDRIVAAALAVLRPGRRVELIGEVVTPLVHAALGLLADVPPELGKDFERYSVVFDRYIGFRRRRHLDDALVRLRERLRDAPGWAARTDDEANALLALVLLGNDTLASAIGGTLHQCLARHPGRRLAEIAFPDMPTESGVPYVERIPDVAVAYRGLRFAPGDRLRIYVHSFAAADEGDAGRIFGVGPHACLGKPASLDLWRGLAERLAGLPYRAAVVDYEVRTEDYLFNVPKRIEVDLWE